MKHLKKYNENYINRELSKDAIESCFVYAFDLCENFEIDEVYADSDKKKNNLYDFYHNIGTEKSYIEGYEIKFETNFYDSSSLDDFRNYMNLLNEIDEGINKLVRLYKVDVVQFDTPSNSSVCLQIAYSDVKLVSDLDK